MSNLEEEELNTSATASALSASEGSIPLAQVQHTWTYLSNHVHVLLCLHRDHTVRLRDVAQLVGITERGVTRIVSELEEEGVVTKHRHGRRNTYSISLEAKLRHPLESHLTLGQLLELLSR